MKAKQLSTSRAASRAAVSVHVEDLVIPTYLPAPPDKNPMFLEKRVYQGSNGKVYPLPFTDRIAEKPGTANGRRSGSKTNLSARWCYPRSAVASTSCRTRRMVTTCSTTNP